MIVVTGKKRNIDPGLADQLRQLGASRAEARARLDQAEADLRGAVLSAFDSGASVRVVAEIAGLAPVTVSKWKSGRRPASS